MTDTKYLHSDDAFRRCTNLARQMRKDILYMCHVVGPARKAHPGPALSCTDIVAVLYGEIMKRDDKDPRNAERDRFILSKGHAAPVLYAALANVGYIDKREYDGLRTVGHMLQGHPDMKGTPGVDMTSGSLGHGLSAGLGMALSAKVDNKDYTVYVILGDGECQEGLVWEAIMCASHYGADNLIAIVDSNGFQSCASIMETQRNNNQKQRWEAFGWRALEIDGHDIGQIIGALRTARKSVGKPTVIIAETVKGKGVSFMENDNSWHQKAINLEQYKTGMKEIEDCDDA